MNTEENPNTRIVELILHRTKKHRGKANTINEQKIHNVAFLFAPQIPAELKTENRKPTVFSERIQEEIDTLKETGILATTKFDGLMEITGNPETPELDTLFPEQEQQIMGTLTELQTESVAQLATTLFATTYNRQGLLETTPTSWPSRKQLEQNLTCWEQHVKKTVKQTNLPSTREEHQLAIFLLDHLDRNQMHPTELRWYAMLENLHYGNPPADEQEKTMRELLDYPNPQGLHPKEKRVRDMSRVIQKVRENPEELNRKNRPQKEIEAELQPLIPQLHRLITCNPHITTQNTRGTWEHKPSGYKGIYDTQQITVHNRTGLQILHIDHTKTGKEVVTIHKAELLEFLKELRIL